MEVRFNWKSSFISILAWLMDLLANLNTENSTLNFHCNTYKVKRTRPTYIRTYIHICTHKHMYCTYVPAYNYYGLSDGACFVSLFITVNN